MTSYAKEMQAPTSSWRAAVKPIASLENLPDVLLSACRSQNGSSNRQQRAIKVRERQLSQTLTRGQPVCGQQSHSFLSAFNSAKLWGTECRQTEKSSIPSTNLNSALSKNLQSQARWWHSPSNLSAAKPALQSHVSLHGFLSSQHKELLVSCSISLFLISLCSRVPPTVVFPFCKLLPVSKCPPAIAFTIRGGRTSCCWMGGRLGN